MKKALFLLFSGLYIHSSSLPCWRWRLFNAQFQTHSSHSLLPPCTPHPTHQCAICVWGGTFVLFQIDFSLIWHEMCRQRGCSCWSSTKPNTCSDGEQQCILSAVRPWCTLCHVCCLLLFENLKKKKIRKEPFLMCCHEKQLCLTLHCYHVYEAPHELNHMLKPFLFVCFGVFSPHLIRCQTICPSSITDLFKCLVSAPGAC